MLARANRLTRSHDFADAIRSGGRAGRESIVLHLGEGDGATPRVGLVVGRRVGNAVVRNQVKRRLRHVARARVDALPAGARLVVRALPPSAEASSSVLARDFDAALHRLLRGAR